MGDKKQTSIYVIGSLRNPLVPKVAMELRNAGYDAYDAWYSCGPRADEHWKEHEELMGHSYQQALDGYHAKQVFEMDMRHLNRCDGCVLVGPAGKSAHLELGWMLGKGKFGYVLLEENSDRFDIMYQFCTKIFFDVKSMIKELNEGKNDFTRFGIQGTSGQGYSGQFLEASHSKWQ